MRAIYTAVTLGAALLLSSGCKEALPPFDAAREPDRAAWTLFADINRPVRHGESRWETWAVPGQLFPDSGGQPQWPASTPPKKFEKLLQQLLLKEILSLSGLQVPDDFDPKRVLSDSEVHLNCAAFAFVVSNGMWHIDGQKDYARRVQSGESGPVNMPAEALAVKAVWRELQEGDDRSRFHLSVTPDKKTWGLIAIHLTSKVLPNWLWATWEHLEVEHAGRKDTFGFPRDSGPPSTELLKIFKLAGLGSEWRNYRLVGSQIDFTDSMGQPTVVGNAIIERHLFDHSSCVTCHSYSTLDKDNVRLAARADLGPPNRSLFEINGTPRYAQMDFLWTLGRANLMLQAPGAVKAPDCSKIPF